MVSPLDSCGPHTRVRHSQSRWSFQVCVPSRPALEEARGADTEEYRGLARSSREGNEPSPPDAVGLTEGDAFASEGPLHLDSSAAWGQGLCPPREAFRWTLCSISAETHFTLRQWTKTLWLQDMVPQT